MSTLCSSSIIEEEWIALTSVIFRPDTSIVPPLLPPAVFFIPLLSAHVVRS